VAVAEGGREGDGSDLRGGSLKEKYWRDCGGVLGDALGGAGGSCADVWVESSLVQSCGRRRSGSKHRELSPARTTIIHSHRTLVRDSRRRRREGQAPWNIISRCTPTCTHCRYRPP